jgi:hypothetical protein
MTNVVSNLVNAVQVLRTIDEKVSFEEVNPVQFSRALKTFANIGYKTGFKTLTDKYLKLANSCGNKTFAENSYRYVRNMCLSTDNAKNGYPELHLKKMKEGSAVKLFEDIYFKEKSKEQIASLMERPKEQVVNIKHNVDGYTQEEVYKKIEDFSNVIFLIHPNRIANAEKVWNGNKNEMNFNFYSRGYNISGYVQLKGKELVIKSKLPPVVKPHIDGIKRKAEKTLEEILPRLALSQ